MFEAIRGSAIAFLDTPISQQALKCVGCDVEVVVLAFVEEKDDKADNIRIYPNPFDTELTIELRANQSQTATIKLYSITGQVVFVKQLTVEKGLNKVSISPAISNGVYLLLKLSNNQYHINKLFV